MLKSATMIFGFVISGETRVFQSKILSCPVCVLLIYYQVRRLGKLNGHMEK